jgi:hypothetical protein
VVTKAPTLDQRVISEVATRLRHDPGLTRLNAQGEQCGWCAQPIRLFGSSTRVSATTGEVVSEYSTLSSPDGVLLKACGTRRTTRCVACALRYRADARMLVRAGLIGGKGVGEDVVRRPMVFATFTAPSFGAVHRASEPGTKNRCHPGASPRCSHGRAMTCRVRHQSNDELIGQPLCAECYDYEGAVLWNATCPELWRRTTIAVTRALAAHQGVSVALLRQVARLSFVKVAEFQRRGVVHLHAVIRLDGAEGSTQAPPAALDVATLLSVVRSVATTVAAPVGDDSSRVRWGRQFDVRALNEVSPRDLVGAGSVLDVTGGVRRIANYLAKYATKSTDDSGALDRRLSGLDDLEGRHLPAHLRRMAETAWRLGGVEGKERLRHWAHSLGFGGHFLTKSRRYSVTFKFLRAERQDWQIERQRTRQGQPCDANDVVSIGRWAWVGSGWRSVGDAWLASVFQRERDQSRLCARDERRVDVASSKGRDSWL